MPNPLLNMMMMCAKKKVKFCCPVLLLQHVLATALSHLQGAHKFFNVCCLCDNLFGRSFTCMIKIIDKIKILKSLKSVWTIKSYFKQILM
jgi:hypothetical protein